MFRFIISFDGLSNHQRSILTQALIIKGIKCYAFPVQSTCFAANDKPIDLKKLGQYLFNLFPNQNLVIYEVCDLRNLNWVQGDKQVDDWIRGFINIQPVEEQKTQTKEQEDKYEDMPLPVLIFLSLFGLGLFILLFYFIF